MPALVLTAFLLALPAADLRVSTSPKGVVEVHDTVGLLARIILTAHGPDWAGASQDSPQATVEREQDIFRGVIPLPAGSAGEMRFVQSVGTEKGRVILDYEVEFTEDSPL
ncbi:MAG: hypothetical protein N2512_06215, partial [Armatimonadetes bacterium]|nr:hypothetical protein [Armatimonadota bacterium]